MSDPPNKSLSQADLLMFDGLLAPATSNVASTAKLAASLPSSTAASAGTDWFSLLATSSQQSKSSSSHSNAATHVLQPVPHSAPAPNYNLARNLFQTSLASSPSPVTSPSPSLVSTSSPALLPIPLSTAAHAVAQKPPKPPLPRSTTDDDFGDFISEPLPISQASASPISKSSLTSTAIPPQSPALPLSRTSPLKLQIPLPTSSPVSSHARTSSNASNFSSSPNRRAPHPTVPRPPPEYKSLESRTSTYGQKQQRHVTPLSQNGAISAHSIPASPRARPPNGSGSSARSTAVPIQPLRFGQHLSGPDGHVVSASVPALTQLSPVQKSQARSPILKAPPPKPPKFVDASDDFEPWSESASSSSTPEPALSTAQQPRTPLVATLPAPEFLLSLFQSNLFPLPMPLFQSLVPLSFPLKRRVISAPRVKDFFEAFILAIEVAIRISAGRKRRGARFEADKEARETARLWRSLRERIAGVGLRDLPNLDASFTLRSYAGDPRELCIVCGVARHEKVRGCTKEVVWDFENGGHSTCIRWWAHEKALMES
ncbi:uncharacterized protein V2V93DRAFT_64642 [Kockiozyma suomiensis]|uniref:uncharacterized protein n=1 Tax=Kockiozyma suomiensis TaxID=1337062 RepID=UPI003343D5FD